MGTMLDYDKAADYLRRGQWGNSDSDRPSRRRDLLDLGALKHGLEWFNRHTADRLFHGLLFIEYAWTLFISMTGSIPVFFSQRCRQPPGQYRCQRLGRVDRGHFGSHHRQLLPALNSSK